MSTLIQGPQVRDLLFGSRIQKAYPTLAVETKALFVVAGGKVLVTSIVGEVTTAITVTGTSKLQHNPTVGATADLCVATDLGSTDTPAGNLVAFQGLAADSMHTGPGAVPTLSRPIVLTAGVIEQVNATGANGGITWVLTYVPLDNGASIAAAA